MIFTFEEKEFIEDASRFTLEPESKYEETILEYFRQHGISNIEIKKFTATIYIDDCGCQFKLW